VPRGPVQGGALIVGDWPTVGEEGAGVVFSSEVNSQLRAFIEYNYQGTVVYASAVGCSARGEAPSDKEIAACRPYLKAIIDEAKPERIICLGKVAYRSVLGTKTPAKDSRRGYNHLEDGTPVFMFPTARSQYVNVFHRRCFLGDMVWALQASPEPAPFDMQVEIIETADDAKLACDELRKGGRFSYDTETSGLIGSDFFRVLCLAAATADAGRVFLWDWQALLSVREDLVELMRDDTVKKTGHNLKYDLKAAAHGIAGLIDDFGRLLVKGVDTDTLLLTKMLDSEVLCRLEYQAERVGMGGHKEENKAALDMAVASIRAARAKPRQRIFPGLFEPAMEAALRHPLVDEKSFAFGLIPPTILHRYCALDTVATARLRNLMHPDIERADHHRLVNSTFVRPSTGALAQIESWGMSASPDAARLAGLHLRTERDKAMTKIRALGCDINIASPAQLSEYLFGRLGLPVYGRTPTGGASTKAEFLKPLAEKHPVVEPLLLHSKLDKLIGTYADGLIPHIRNGRIYTNINQDGTRSGRWSSSSPNLQNIPSGGPWAKYIKSIFTAPPGHLLIQLDYSQLELRVAAMLTGDPKMIQIYKDGQDFHRRTAELIAPAMWKIDASQVTKDHRRSAKAFNFGVWYGQGDGTIAKNLAVSRKIAAQLRHEVLGQFTEAGPWIDGRKTYAQMHGITWTYWDGQHARVRQLPDIVSYDDKLKSTAMNGSFNTAVQGTAALFMERTIGEVVRWILSSGLPVRVTNTVHDSIILEVPFRLVNLVIDVVTDIMESWPSGPVPLVADAEIGSTWASLRDYALIKKVANFTARNMFTDEEICKVLGILTDPPTKAPDLVELGELRRLAKLVGRL